MDSLPKDIKKTLEIIKAKLVAISKLNSKRRSALEKISKNIHDKDLNKPPHEVHTGKMTKPHNP
ncbi:MAG: hypothetical protein HQ521_20600 [Bacteroidetes bacterium]|nr:hypothetical protein [Bacteroidota bacterium]